MRPRPAALEPSASAWASSQAASLSATLSVTRVTRPADCRLLPTVAASPHNQTSRGAQSTAAVRRDTEYSRWLPTIRRGANRRQRPDYAVTGPIQALALMGYSLNLVQDGTYVNDKNPDLIWEARRATLVSQDRTSSTTANHERLQHWCQSVVVVVDGCIIDVLRDRQLSFATCSPLSVTATLPVGVAA